MLMVATLRVSKNKPPSTQSVPLETYNILDPLTSTVFRTIEPSTSTAGKGVIMSNSYKLIALPEPAGRTTNDSGTESLIREI